MSSLRGTFFGVISNWATRCRKFFGAFGASGSAAGRGSSTVATPPAPSDSSTRVSSLARRRRIIIGEPSVRVDGAHDLGDGRDVVLDELDSLVLESSHSLRDG